MITKLLNGQKEFYLSQIASYTFQVDQLQKQLASLHTREQQFYRSLLNIKPLALEVWQAGYGGGETYNQIEPRPLRTLAQQIHSLRYQISLQKEAFAESISKSHALQQRTQALPSAIPTRGTCVSGYGHRCTNHLGTHFHAGVDLAARHGSPVYAAGAGIVRVVGWTESGYGLQVLIDHQNGFVTRYAHLSAAVVNQGQYVERGQIIARVGSTGLSFGPHLHYEVLDHGRPLNPQAFMIFHASKHS